MTIIIDLYRRRNANTGFLKIIDFRKSIVSEHGLFLIDYKISQNSKINFKSIVYFISALPTTLMILAIA